MSDDKSERVVGIIRALKEKYPEASCTLDAVSPFQLLIMTILAAQSTDKNVNAISPALFAKYPTPVALSSADPLEVEEAIHSTGFFRQKARAIIEASQDILDVFGGSVPDTMEELTKLRGVGRKTANVVLGNAFKKPALIVDTHVLRVSGRLRLVDPKLSEKKEAEKVERALMEIVPEEDWTFFSNALLYLGREFCTARNPNHQDCPLLHLCPTGQAAVQI